jgi:hypothetical protein
MHLLNAKYHWDSTLGYYRLISRLLQLPLLKKGEEALV